MTKEARLEWQYTPPDYFEEPVSFEFDQIRLEIADGCITAHLSASLYDQEKGCRDEIEEELTNRFLGAQLINHKPYKISGMAEFRTKADGKENVIIHPKPAFAVAGAGNPDIKITDADNSVLVDTKAERIKRQLGLSERVAKHAPLDVILRGMVQSHRRAVSDPDNELISLY